MNSGNSSVRVFTNPFLVLALLATGTFSGLLGIGGGVMLIPSLVYLGKLNQKIAHGTSLCCVILIAVSGLLGYIVDGTVNYWVVLCLVPGALIGVRFGTWLLSRISVSLLKFIFGVFTCFIAIRLVVGVGSGKEDIVITIGLAVGCVLVGLLAGFLAGLFGVGGGIIMVPSLIIIFDFIGSEARGTSLLVILPTAILGTYRNFRHKNLDLSTGIKLGIIGASMSIVGSILSRYIPEIIISRILAGVLMVVAARIFWEFMRLKTAKL